MSDWNEALEVRLRWLDWVTRYKQDGFITPEQGAQTDTNDWRLYQQSLATGETFVMNERFCELVDTARATIPDELAFDPEWMIRPYGWMWLKKPFKTPAMDAKEFEALSMMEREEVQRIAAVSWMKLNDDSYQFMCYQDLRIIYPGAPGFSMWSFFILQKGQKVIDRIHAFEHNSIRRDATADLLGIPPTKPKTAAAYVSGKVCDMLHEIRWIYTAMHLMSQKLATTVQQTAQRSFRRRMERDNLPIAPFVRIVTLRRLEEDRKKESRGDVDWRWQWRVTGHWRNQYYPSKQSNEIIWIEDYIKGPEDKPLKPPSHTLYKVAR